MTLLNRFFKRMQKQGSKHRSIASMLNKIFGKYFTVFNVFADTAANFIKNFSLPQIRTIHIHVSLLHSLFLLLAFFACLLVCLFICLVKMVLLLLCHLSFFSMYMHLFMLLWVGSLYYDFTII